MTPLSTTKQRYDLTSLLLSRVEASIATVFWNIYLLSTHFTKRVEKPPDGFQDGDEGIVVPHGYPNHLCFNLLYLQSQFQQKHPMLMRIPARFGLADAWHAWRDSIQKLATLRSERDSPHRALAEIYLHVFSRPERVKEIQDTQNFSILVAQKPFMEALAAPARPWGIGLFPNEPVKTTVSDIVKDSANRVGFIGCLHALENLLACRHSSELIGRRVYIRNFPDAPDDHPDRNKRLVGIIRKIDQTSDSFFIECRTNLPKGLIGKRGASLGLSPCYAEDATFFGRESYDWDKSSGQRVHVLGWSPDILYASRNSKAKLYTERVAQPGDSGSPLIDAYDHILGFCYRRTSNHQHVDFTSWVWADLVYQNLHLTSLAGEERIYEIA